MGAREDHVAEPQVAQGPRPVAAIGRGRQRLVRVPGAPREHHHGDRDDGDRDAGGDRGPLQRPRPDLLVLLAGRGRRLQQQQQLAASEVDQVRPGQQSEDLEREGRVERHQEPGSDREHGPQCAAGGRSAGAL